MVRGFENPSEKPRTVKPVRRVQTGVRIEKRLLKVLKALAEYHDLTLAELIEGIVLHAFEGRCLFGDESLRVIASLRSVYGLELGVEDCRPLVEDRGEP